MELASFPCWYAADGVHHPNGGNASLEAFGKLTSLKQLDCALLRADDEGIHHLKGLKNLEKLGLIRTPVSGAVVEILSDLPNLKQIKLKYPRMMPDSCIAGVAAPWPAGAQGSGIFERNCIGKFKELTNAEIAKRGYW